MRGKETDRAAEIWRRIEKMGKDERGCGFLPLRGYLKLPENTYYQRTDQIIPKGTILAIANPIKICLLH